VEGADLVIDAGGVSFNEINTAAYTSHIDPGTLVTIGVDHVRLGDRIYNPVRMGDVFDGLAGSVKKKFGYRAPPKEVPTRPGGKPDDPITAENMYPRFRDFLKPRDRIVLESGSVSSGMVPLPLPEGAEDQRKHHEPESIDESKLHHALQETDAANQSKWMSRLLF
jgi:indolepyruvate decarboxylase